MSKKWKEYKELERFIDRHCPLEAGYYFLNGFNENNQVIRFPATGTWHAQQPFEAPTAPAGQFFVYYSKDSAGREVVPHVGREGPLRLVLRRGSEGSRRVEARGNAVDWKGLPAVGSMAPPAPASEPYEDDEEGSLKATRIEAKKREIAIDLTDKEQQLFKHSTVNKELVEGFMLNRAHRLEVRDQSEAIFRVQNQTLTMSERNLVLIEKIQESMGRAAELEKAAAQRAASPPGPIDYSPVLNGVVAAIRDIGVSALQRDVRSKPKGDEDAALARIAEQAPRPDSLQGASTHATSAAPLDAGSSMPAHSSNLAAAVDMRARPTETRREPADRDAYAQLLAARAEVERLRAELAAVTGRSAPVAESVDRTAVDKSDVPNGSSPPTPEIDAHTTLRSDVQDLLISLMGGGMPGSATDELPRPSVRPVALLEEVLVAPSKMDPATARRLLKDGTAIESLGAFLFFNPMMRTLLLSRRR